MSQAKVVERKVFYAGNVVFREGEEGDRAYLLQEGAIEIVSEAAGGKVLGVITPGSLFGEMALIDDKPRMATARAKEQSTVVIIGRQAFQEKLQKADPFIRGLLKIFVRNIRQMADK
ncbi:MAG: cyclic nucleotide-binding domain-containing protein [Alphaproteobacteria bacterium]|nr:cyclic nucleotide-binding domain-containing protein [Alphaproteobacteria bacterium]MBF0128511.1 cyclic nucleotide-binding domain-containing protein [Alphaproteobacteria bacterium]